MGQRIYLVRHGETRFNKEDRMRGRLDEPLSDTGISQAKRTADFFTDREIRHIFTSPLQRAYNTSLEIGRKCGLTPVREEAFNDLDFGDWQGMLRKEIRIEFPEHYHIYEYHPEEFISSAGDSLWALRRRSFKRLDEITRDISSDFAIVSHYVTLRMLLLACLDLTPGAYWKINLDNCSISTLLYDRHNKYTILRINSACHLD